MKLKFGTGGLRAVMGRGEECMNIAAIQEATLGVAAYAKKIAKKPSVAIAYDTRNNSEDYAKETARILALEGCLVFIYPIATPTPMLSFAVRELKCHLGICITASHNPKEYNGYKVYGEDGCQITSKAANVIQKEIENVDKDSIREWKTFEEFVNERKIVYISERINELYLKTIQKFRLNKEPLKGVKIVYTPLNGTGLFPMLETLQFLGIRDAILVEEQIKPDGNFPTCPCPNPEEDEALKPGIAMCQKTNADILLATDPDSDRLGVAAKHGSKYERLNGNQLGVLLLNYILKSRRDMEDLPDNPVVIKTIVTTSMADKIAAEYGAEIVNTLTGFKYIGEQLGRLEESGEIERFLFGLEESCGYLIGPYVRDKDAIGTAMLVCEMAEYYKSLEMTLWDALEELYEKYGRYESELKTYEMSCNDAAEAMRKLRTKLHEKQSVVIDGLKVLSYMDYLQGIDHLPKSDVLLLRFENDLRMILRPSGTEPKIKVYREVCKMVK